MQPQSSRKKQRNQEDKLFKLRLYCKAEARTERITADHTTTVSIAVKEEISMGVVTPAAGPFFRLTDQQEAHASQTKADNPLLALSIT